MNRNIYKSNIQLFEKSFPGISKIIENRRNSIEKETEVYFEQAADGNKIIKVKKEDRQLYFSGKRGGSPGYAGDSSVLSEAGQFSCEDLRPDQGSGEDQYHRGEKKDFRQRQKALCHEGIEHPGISCHDTGGERGEGCRDSGNLHEQAGTGRVLTD